MKTQILYFAVSYSSNLFLPHLLFQCIIKLVYFQWQNIAINVYQSLTSNAGVLFYGIIQVV